MTDKIRHFARLVREHTIRDQDYDAEIAALCDKFDPPEELSGVEVKRGMFDGKPRLLIYVDGTLRCVLRRSGVGWKVSGGASSEDIYNDIRPLRDEKPPEHLRNELSKKQRKIDAQKELLDKCTDKIAAQRSSLRNKASQIARLKDEKPPASRELMRDIDNFLVSFHYKAMTVEQKEWWRKLIDKVRRHSDPRPLMVMERELLSVEEAKARDVCRICQKDWKASPGNPFVLNFGKEYAHQKCLDALPVVTAEKLREWAGRIRSKSWPQVVIEVEAAADKMEGKA